MDIAARRLAPDNETRYRDPRKVRATRKPEPTPQECERAFIQFRLAHEGEFRYSDVAAVVGDLRLAMAAVNWAVHHEGARVIRPGWFAFSIPEPEIWEKNWLRNSGEKVCACGCGKTFRPVNGRQKYATSACKTPEQVIADRKTRRPLEYVCRDCGKPGGYHASEKRPERCAKCERERTRK